ncbi:MAG: hypothetical protein WA104_00935 [Thermodesulfovibrionales bacterium]
MSKVSIFWEISSFGTPFYGDDLMRKGGDGRARTEVEVKQYKGKRANPVFNGTNTEPF